MAAPARRPMRRLQLMLVWSAVFSMVYGWPLQMAMANPAGGTVVAGSASINSSGSQLTVNQNSSRAIINWQSFSVGQGEVTRFVQPSAQAAILNRVTGGDPSAILGAMQANGQVYLINPNGIIFGPNANINVGSLVASTLNVANDQFMRGGDLNFSGNSTAGVYNFGRIQALEGDIYLIGSNVANHGVLQASRGTVGLLAGQSVTLVDGSRPHLPVTANGRSISKTGVVNTGLIDAVRVELAANGGNVYALAINNTGTVRATGSVEKNGRIYLTAPGGKIANSGDLLAKSGPNGGQVEINAGAGGSVELSGNVDVSGAQGGSVQVLGDQVSLASANITASGTAGDGGVVLVGGDFQGTGDVHRAINTSVSVDSSINVDGGASGNGGRVIVWADNHTDFYGTITGRGGAAGGDGGFAEVSGKASLAFNGAVDLSALGANGTLLLDPPTATISTAAAGPNNINNAALASTLEGGTNVIIMTTSFPGGDGDVLFNAPVIWGLDDTGTHEGSLGVLARNNVGVNSVVIAVDAGTSDTGGNIMLVGGWDETTPLGSIASTPSSWGTYTATASTTYPSFVRGSVVLDGNFNTGLAPVPFGSSDVRVHSQNGDVNVYGYNVILSSQTAGGGSATLGSASSMTTSVNAKFGVTLRSGSDHAQIGIDPTTFGYFSQEGGLTAVNSPIDVDAYYVLVSSNGTGAMPDSAGTYSQIGHGGPQAAFNTRGRIRVRADDTVYVSGVLDGRTAQVGHGGIGYTGIARGDIDIRASYVAADGTLGEAQIGHQAPYAVGDISVRAPSDVQSGFVYVISDGGRAQIGHFFDSDSVESGELPQSGNGVLHLGHIDIDADNWVRLQTFSSYSNAEAVSQIGHRAISNGYGEGVVLAGNIDVTARGDAIEVITHPNVEDDTAQIGHFGAMYRLGEYHDHGPVVDLNGGYDVPPGIFLLGRIQTRSYNDTTLHALGEDSTARIGHWGYLENIGVATGYDPNAVQLDTDFLANWGLGDFNGGGSVLEEIIGPGVYVLGGIDVTAGKPGESGGNIELETSGEFNIAQIGHHGAFVGEGVRGPGPPENDLPQFSGVFIAGNVDATANRFEGAGGNIRVYAGGSPVHSNDQINNISQIGHLGGYDYTTLIVLDEAEYEDVLQYGFNGYQPGINGVVVLGNVSARAANDVSVVSGGVVDVIEGNVAQIGHIGEAYSDGYFVVIHESDLPTMGAEPGPPGSLSGMVEICHITSNTNSPYNLITVNANSVHTSLGGSNSGNGAHGAPNHAHTFMVDNQQITLNDVLPVDGLCPNPFDSGGSQERFATDIPGAGVFVLGNINVRSGNNVYLQTAYDGYFGSNNVAQIGHFAYAEGGRYDNFNVGEQFYNLVTQRPLEFALNFAGDALTSGAYALGDIRVSAEQMVSLNARGWMYANPSDPNTNAVQIGHEAGVYARRDITSPPGNDGYHGEGPNLTVGPVALAWGDIGVRARNGDVLVRAYYLDNSAQIGHKATAEIEALKVPRAPKPKIHDGDSQGQPSGVNVALAIAAGDIRTLAGRDVILETSISADNGTEAQIGHEVNVRNFASASTQPAPGFSVGTSESGFAGFGNRNVLIGLALGDIEVAAGSDVIMVSPNFYVDSQIGHEVNVESRPNEFVPGPRDNLPRVVPDLMFGIASGDISVAAGEDVIVQSGVMSPGFPTPSNDDAQIGHEVNVGGHGDIFTPSPAFTAGPSLLANEIESAGGFGGIGSLALAKGNIAVLAGENVLLQNFASNSDVQIGHEVNGQTRTVPRDFASGEGFNGSPGNARVATIAKGDIKVVALNQDVVLSLGDDGNLYNYYSQTQIGHEVTGREGFVDGIAAARSGYQPPGRGAAFGDIFVLAGRDIKLVNQGLELSEVHIGHGNGRGSQYKILAGDIVGIAGRNFIMEGASSYDLAFIGHDGAWSDTDHKQGRILIAWDQVDSKADNGGRFFMNRYSEVDSGQRLIEIDTGEGIITKMKNRRNLAIFVGTRREGTQPNVIEDGAKINGVVYDSTLENLGDPNGRDLIVNDGNGQRWGENVEFESWSAEQWGYELWDILDNPSLQQLLASCELDLNGATLVGTYSKPFTFYYLDGDVPPPPPPPNDIPVPQLFDYNLFRELPYWPGGVGLGSSRYGQDNRQEDEITGNSSYNVFQP